MSAILNRASRNFLWQHPWQLALAILGITLGVAVVIAIDLALESSLQAFEQSTKTISGKTTHRISATDGGLDEKIYTQLRVEQGLSNIAPIIRGYVTLKQNPKHSCRLFGIDPLIEKSFQSTWQRSQNNSQTGDFLTRLITEPDTALISRHTAEKLHLNIGDTLSIITENGDQHLKIIAILTADNAVSRQALNNLIITDIATAQETLGWYGKLSFIEVQATNSVVLQKIRAALPLNTLLTTSASRTDSMRQITQAFTINLTALGLLSLLVGMFLIYNTMTFLILQRRQLIGTLRSIGVTRQQIFALIISEALLLAGLGTLLGIVVGIGIGHGLLQMVSGTMNSIFFRIDAAPLLITPMQISKAVVLGIGATCVAALPPAWEATKVTANSALIRSQLEITTRRLIITAGSCGLLFIVSGLVIAQVSAKSINFGLGSIFLLLFGFALLTPGCTAMIMQLTEKILSRIGGILGKLPPRMVIAELSRTGIAIAALMIAVAATIGMDLMIGSFRHTVAQWIKTSLRADFYVALSGNSTMLEKAHADHALKEKLATLAGIDMLSSVLHTQILAEDRLTDLSVFQLNSESKKGFLIKQQNTNTWNRFAHEQTIMVTEPYAYHNGVTVGTIINLQTDAGTQPFEVIAIYADYSGDRGHIAMDRQQYQRYWPNLGFTGIGVYASPGTDLFQLEHSIRGLLANYQNLQSDHAIYQASMQIFEQTFSITETLRWLAAGIAFVGVFSALMALQFERTRQFGILRAIGVTPRQLSVLITSETGLMGLVAGLIAIPVGYLVAYILIFVVYQRSFGWTLAFHHNWQIPAQGLCLAIIAALLAGIIPAVKMAKTRPAEALQTE